MNLFPVKKTRSDLTTWEPLAEIATLQDRFAQLFNLMGKEEMLSPLNLWTPAMDIAETDHELVLKVDVPGMEKKDISIEVEDGTLCIKGERKLEKEEKKDNFVHIERNYGSFLRRLPLPEYVNLDDIKANCKNGLLKVTLKKTPGAKKEVKSVSID